MLDVVKKFQACNANAKPIIVADAAMLSRENMKSLEANGYHYIVGARLANTTQSFIEKVFSSVVRQDGALVRLCYPNCNYDVICTYSEHRAKKDRRKFEKQITRAHELIARQVPGKRAKFVKKSEHGYHCGAYATSYGMYTKLISKMR